MLCSGKINITSRLLKLPKTQHIASSFLMDVNLVNISQQPQQILVTLHGKFQTESKLTFSFDRVLLLIGAMDKSKGWPALIINDQLHIRPEIQIDLQQFVQKEQAQATPLKGDLVPQEDKVKMLQIQQLINETNMKPEYAKKCLEDNGWDYRVALERFKQLKAQGAIPPQAFRT